jgi:glutamate-ammonia-ligase adenylyltransferase
MKKKIMSFLDSYAMVPIKETLLKKHFSSLPQSIHTGLRKLIYSSDFAIRRITILEELLHQDDGLSPWFKTHYQAELSQISLDLSEVGLSSVLRIQRNKYFLRLALRELAGLANTIETMLSWSDCADVLILFVLQYCENKLINRYGKPLDEDGAPSQLFPLAMGKLGGRELNFSSDVDLIFSYSSAGYTQGEESISNQEFYTKVIQKFIQLMQTITADGFVFRVDLRLRPNGDSAPVVCTLAAMETYYQEQGRDWERYAMVKARLLPRNGNAQEPSNWFNRLIIPFVYRRYVDFSVIESLRSMKSMIQKEVQLKPMLDDIKRGSGGIREVEFIIQSFQLIRGGRLPALQEQNAIQALHALKQEGLLAHSEALKQAYLFLRKLENTLQLQNDQQTHSLPMDDAIRAQIVIGMGFQDWQALEDRLSQYRRIIFSAFHAILNKPETYEDEKKLLDHQLASLWQGHVETTLANNLLASLGYQQAERCYQMLYAFRHSPRCRRLSQTSRLRLDRFMVLLLNELKKVKETDTVLLQVLHLLENIVGRSAYLALLTENPSVLQELLHWFANSTFIAELLVNQPFLLEVLMDQKQTWRPLSRLDLQKSLRTKLSHFAEEEDEQQEEILRQFKLTCWLLAARAELYGQYSAVAIGQYLADVAEVIISEVTDRACLQLSRRYPELSTLKNRFAIIAYGKLGSREMNYNSDVDLVFLHQAAPSEEGLFTRLTQKILYMLTMRTQTGILYSVDTRLRPSGSAGLLVTHVDAFTHYQLQQAWTWEHQAILRARALTSPAFQVRITRLKMKILSLPHDKSKLAKDVHDMRIKISKHLLQDEIKHGAGGLLDLEFLVQYLILANSHPEFAKTTNTKMQLQKLYEHKVLTKLQLQKLTAAYEHFHSLLHQYLLHPKPILNDAVQEDVIVIREQLLSFKIAP